MGLERITPKYIFYISMYARTNRCYNERGSRNNYVRSSIPHCISLDAIMLQTVSVKMASIVEKFGTGSITQRNLLGLLCFMVLINVKSTVSAFEAGLTLNSEITLRMKTNHSKYDIKINIF